MMIEKIIAIEKLIEIKPDSVKFLMNRGIRCIACGEPVWGSLEDAAREKGLSDEEIGALTEGLNFL